MTKKQFRHDFLRGLGSALIELKTCKDPQKYYDIVHYGCLHNTTYDMQCEGDRGWYLHQAAVLVGGDAILEDVIRRYSIGFSDDWFFHQLVGVLWHFAADGNVAARATLYDKYNATLKHLTRINIKKRQYRISPDRDMFNSLCIWLTDLDGWSAFKRIVNDISEKLLPKDADFFFDEWFYDNSKNKLGKKRIENYLQKQAKKSEAIKIYWEKAQKWDAHVYEKRPAPTVDDIISVAYEGKFAPGLARWFARHADEESLAKLAKAAENEPDLKIRSNLLWAFVKAKYPLSEDSIFELLSSDDEEIHRTAVCVLENNPSPRVRNYALSLLKNREDSDSAISLLSKSILPEDEQLFCDAVKSIPVKFSEGDWHGAFMSAEKGIENLRGKPKTDLLQYIYRETYCSCCRERIVELMHKKKVLPDDILQECLYDCNLDIQAFAKRILKRKQ